MTKIPPSLKLTSLLMACALTALTLQAAPNLAPTATLTVDSTHGAYTKNLAVDGIKNTTASRWVSTNTVAAHSFQMDWSSAQSINNVKVWSGIMTGQGYEIDDYTVQYWNGSAWITVASIINNTMDGFAGQFNDLTFPSISTTKLKLAISTGSATDYHARLMEVEVYGGVTFNFYISPTGTGTADTGGTLANPWPISMLNNPTARGKYAGKVVGLMNGTYNIYSLLTPLAYDQYAFTVAGGTVSSPTRIAAVNPRQAILSCKQNGSYGGGNPKGPSVIGLLGEYITIDGLAITGHTRRGICVGNASGITNPSRRGIVIKNCEFYDFSGTELDDDVNISQIELNDSLGTLIQNNYFHDNIGVAVGDGDHFQAVEVWSSGLGVFEYNTIKNQAGGFQGKAQWHDTYSNVFRYNYIDLSAGVPGTTTAGGIFGFNEGTSYQANIGRAATEIHNNVIIGLYPVLLRNVYLDTRTTRFFHPVKIYNNSLKVTAGGGIGCTLIVDSSALASHFNNIITRVSGSADLQGMNQMSAAMTTLIDYDHFFQQSGTRNWFTSPAYDGSVRSTWSSVAAFANAMGNNQNGTTVEQNGNGVGTDPLYVGSGIDALAYKLQTGSPCKNDGKSNGASSGTICDMGAWGGAVPPTRIGCDF